MGEAETEPENDGNCFNKTEADSNQIWHTRSNLPNKMSSDQVQPKKIVQVWSRRILLSPKRQKRIRTTGIKENKIDFCTWDSVEQYLFRVIGSMTF